MAGVATTSRPLSASVGSAGHTAGHTAGCSPRQPSAAATPRSGRTRGSRASRHTGRAVSPPLSPSEAAGACTLPPDDPPSQASPAPEGDGSGPMSEAALPGALPTSPADYLWSPLSADAMSITSRPLVPTAIPNGLADDGPPDGTDSGVDLSVSTGGPTGLPLSPADPGDTGPAGAPAAAGHIAAAAAALPIPPALQPADHACPPAAAPAPAPPHQLLPHGPVHGFPPGFPPTSPVSPAPIDISSPPTAAAAAAGPLGSAFDGFALPTAVQAAGADDGAGAAYTMVYDGYGPGAEGEGEDGEMDSHSDGHAAQFDEPLSASGVPMPRLAGDDGGEQETQTLFSQLISATTNTAPPPEAAQRDAPCPRFGHTAVVHQDTMIVYGGRDAKCYDDVWAYDFVSKRWRRITQTQGEQERPRARAGHTAVVHKSKMYVFGGVAEQETGGHTLWLSDLWTLDLKTWQWEPVRSKGGQVPDKRKGHTAVVSRSSMYVFGGGQDDLTMHGDLWEFSFATQKWILRPFTGHTPQPRMYHVAVVGTGGRLLVFGGRAQTTTGFLNDLFEIDLTTFKCSALTPGGPAPTHRMCSTAVYHNHTLAIFTGGSYAYLEDSHQLDLRKMRWAPIDGVRFGGRTRPTTVKWRNTVLTFGGCVHGNGYVNDFITLELAPMPLRQMMKEYCLERRIDLADQRVPGSLIEYIEE